jgi:hypothetical protein
MTATLRIAAILAVDVVGYSRLMGQDEAGTGQPHEASLKSGMFVCSYLHGSMAIGRPPESESLSSPAFRSLQAAPLARTTFSTSMAWCARTSTAERRGPIRPATSARVCSFVQLLARSMPTKHYLIVQRGPMEGFPVLDYMSRAAEAIDALAGWVQAGKIKNKVDVRHGLENAPATVRRLFEGCNEGKQLPRVAE